MHDTIHDRVYLGEVRGRTDTGIVVSAATHQRVESDREDSDRAGMQEKFRDDSIVRRTLESVFYLVLISAGSTVCSKNLLCIVEGYTHL